MKYDRVISKPITMRKKQWDVVQRLADQKHEGNRSRALREIVDVYEEADDAADD